MTLDKSYQFDFGIGEAAPGYTKITAATVYTAEQGYGFQELKRVAARDRKEPAALRRDFCIPMDTAFLVDLPNGRYNVTLLLGDAITETVTTVKSGSGRLMLHKLRTGAGQFEKQSFSVQIDDGQLKLSFSGLAPRINAMDIVPSKQTTTIFLAGDSTVTDETEDNFPFAGWGQMLPQWFRAEVAVSNHAKSGRSSKSFIGEGRLDTILQSIQANDYLFIQFGHNDQKSDEERHTDPFTTYQEHLMRYIDAARERGAHPVLITSVQRRFFAPDGTIVDTHGEYLTAMRELAASEQVPLIDLAERSKALFEALGPEETKSVFMWAAPGEFIHFPRGVEDNTHFQENGAIRIAKLVADGIRELRLQPLTLYLKS